MRYIDKSALLWLKAYRPQLTAQQYKTLRGQVLAGDAEGAMKGLRKLLMGGGRATEQRTPTMGLKADAEFAFGGKNPHDKGTNRSLV